MLQGCYNSNPICKHPAFLNNGCVPYGKKEKIFSMKVFPITQKKELIWVFNKIQLMEKRSEKQNRILSMYGITIMLNTRNSKKSFTYVQTWLFFFPFYISIYNNAENANYVDVNKRGWHFLRSYYGFRYETNDYIA